MSFACPSSRYGHVAAVINDEMLVWGGGAVRESTGDLYLCSQDVMECFNLLTSQWNERRATSNSQSDLPHPCLDARIGVVQNQDIYQFGGVYFSSDQGRDVYLNDVHKLDGSTLEWQRIHSNDQSTPSGRSGHGMCVLGKKGDEQLVMMGGLGTKIVSPIPDGSQFIPHSKYPEEGWNNEVWLFCIQKRNWIPAQCTGKKPHPRSAHSFTKVDINRAILISGGPERLLNDAFLFIFSSLEWIEMKLDDHVIPRFLHSTVVVDIPTLGGPVAFLLWGYGKDGFPVSLAQMILIDSQKCKKISISDEPIPTGRQSVCSIVRRGLLFILRYGGSPYNYAERKPGAFLDILKYDLKSVGEKLLRHNLSEPIEHEISKSDEHAQKMTEEPLSDPSLQIDRQDLVYDEDDDCIGEGSFGDVFKATLKKDGKEITVAVKVFADIRRKSERELFKKEASVLLRIEPNPFIVRLIGVCTAHRFHALVTEFVSGGDLSCLLKSDEEAIEKWETRVTFAKQIAKGMLHLHGNHPPVIHYDLKAENVLVERIPDEREDQFICKVADFGLSKMSGVSSITVVRQTDSAPSGTVTHVAPERYSRRPYGAGDDEVVRKVLAKKSDVYSYGVLLWEIRERTHPYQGTDRDTIRYLVRTGEKLPEGEALNVPPFFDDLMTKCTQFDPQNRPMFDDIILTLTENESD
ncbi:uncharacterized protein [Oscarella lobularis]|uniref:uncharacterized protein n=1 Tax=Oscarella lobularis TaxID=121494 RepID=UPI0033144CD4